MPPPNYRACHGTAVHVHTRLNFAPQAQRSIFVTSINQNTVDKSLFIAITRCCAGILGMLCCIMESVIPFPFSLHSVRILLSKSTASIDSCFITMSATAILHRAAQGD